MARSHGRFAQVYVGIASSTAAAEAIPNSSNWTAEFSTDRKDGTAFGDTNKVKVAGLPDATGKIEGFWDSGTAQTYTAATDGLKRRAYFYPTTPSTAGPYWFGEIYVDFDIDVGVEDIVKFKATWDAAGPISKNSN